QTASSTRERTFEVSRPTGGCGLLPRRFSLSRRLAKLVPTNPPEGAVINRLSYPSTLQYKDRRRYYFDWPYGLALQPWPPGPASFPRPNWTEARPTLSREPVSVQAPARKTAP